MQTKQISIMNLEAGMIVHFYGARFEIVSAEVRTHITGHDSYDNRPERREDRVMVAQAKWLDGHIESGYFGPNKDWTFQGNHYVSHVVEI